MARWADAALAGFHTAIPADAPSSIRSAFAYWRVTVVSFPCLLLLFGFGGFVLGQGALRLAADISIDGLLILMTLGLILVFVFLLFLMGIILMVMGVLTMLLAPVIFVLLSRALGRIIRGESRGVALAAWIAVPILFVGGLLSFFLVLDLANGLVLKLIALGVILLAVAVVVTGPVLLLLPSNRHWLALRHVRRADRDEAPSAEVPAMPTSSRFAP